MVLTQITVTVEKINKKLDMKTVIGKSGQKREHERTGKYSKVDLTGFFSLVLALLLLMSFSNGVLGVIKENSFLKVVSSFPPDISNCFLDSFELNGPKSLVVACTSLCLSTERCYLSCLEGSKCFLYKAQVTLLWTGWPGSDAVSYSSCYSHWAQPYDEMGTATVTASATIDGRPATLASNGFLCKDEAVGCYMSGGVYEPYWKADFGEPIRMEMILLFARNNGAKYALTNIEVSIGNDPAIDGDNQLIAYYNGVGLDEELKFKPPTGPVEAQYLFIKKLGDAPLVFAKLRVCDVQVLSRLWNIR